MKFTKRYLLFFVLFFCCKQTFSQSLPSKDSITKQMEKVADWQLSQQWPTKRQANGKLVMGPKTWEAGAFYPGVLEMYRVSNNKKYLNAVINLARNNNYECGLELHNGDDQAILQTYIELYEFDKNPAYLAAARKTLDTIMQCSVDGAKEYSWCDLLFMAPPIWARFARITNEQKYLDFEDKIYWEAVDNLWSRSYDLFYRDDRFKTLQTEGKPIFWGRGNGWVIAGLARLMEYMPHDYKNRKKYEELMVNMAASLKQLQQKDGFWKSNLLQPDLYPMGETSGTVFFCYGIAWGINHGILSREEYLPVVQNAWHALSTAVHPDGKLGFVQPGGDRPFKSDYEMSNWYSAGGFLMAGRQILALKQ
jgi:unsaturated rhamnogalacturonyl hydrolase